MKPKALKLGEQIFHLVGEVSGKSTAPENERMSSILEDISKGRKGE